MNRREALGTVGLTIAGLLGLPKGGGMNGGREHHLLFEAAKRFDKTSPCPILVEDADSPLDGVGRALGRKQAPGNTLYVGSGIQLDKYRSALVNNKRGVVIRLEHLDHWTFNLPEVMRVLHEFLLEARERPAMLWSHTVCWTDRAVNKYANNVLISNRFPEETDEFSYGIPVELHFRPKSRRKVTVRTDALHWRRPSGLPDSGEPFLKMAKTRIHSNLGAGRKFLGVSYKETLGGASDGWQDDPLVKAGRLPGLHGIVYGLAVDYKGASQLLRSPFTQRNQCIDSSGIIDVFLLKCVRLFEPNEIDDVMAEELVFAFDREGMIAYISTSWQRFEGLPEEFRWGAHLCDWTGRNCPNGKAF